MHSRTIRIRALQLHLIVTCFSLPIYETSATVHNYPILSCASKNTNRGTRGILLLHSFFLGQV